MKRLYGFDDADLDDRTVRPILDSAKKFCRRVGISYEELVTILKTRFVNPDSHLTPRLNRLGIPFATLKAFKGGLIDDVQQAGRLWRCDAVFEPRMAADQRDALLSGWATAVARVRGAR